MRDISTVKKWWCWQEKEVLQLIRDNFNKSQLPLAISLYTIITEQASYFGSDTFNIFGIKLIEQSGIGYKSYRDIMNKFIKLWIIIFQKWSLKRVPLTEKIIYWESEISLLQIGLLQTWSNSCSNSCSEPCSNSCSHSGQSNKEIYKENKEELKEKKATVENKNLKENESLNNNLFKDNQLVNKKLKENQSLSNNNLKENDSSKDESLVNKKLKENQSLSNNNLKDNQLVNKKIKKDVSLGIDSSNNKLVDKNDKCSPPPYRRFDHLSISMEEFEKLSVMYEKEVIDNVLDAIENHSKNKKYKSLYLTALTWLRKNPELKKKQKNIDEEILRKYKPNWLMEKIITLVKLKNVNMDFTTDDVKELYDFIIEQWMKHKLVTWEWEKQKWDALLEVMEKIIVHYQWAIKPSNNIKSSILTFITNK